METRVSDKVLYKIGEVSTITGLPASALRFWESEFSFLCPRKSQGRHRVYDQRTIAIILEIKHMLYEEGYTITGLKRHWERRGRCRQGPAPGRVEHIRNELRDLLNGMDALVRKPGRAPRPYEPVDGRSSVHPSSAAVESLSGRGAAR